MGNVREKLNSVHFTTAVITAGFLGGLTGSWFVFLLTLGVALYAALESGDIRLSRRKQ